MKVFLPLLIVECGTSETLCSREKSVCFGYFIPLKTHQTVKLSLQRGHEGKQKWRLKGGKKEEKNPSWNWAVCHREKKKIVFFFFFALLLFYFLFWSASLFTSGLHDRKSERRVLPVWTLVNTLEAWENVKAQLWSECCKWSGDSFSAWVCLCTFVCAWGERESERDVVFVCGTMCAADAAIFISHSWRPRKCSVSWLTVIFSVSACLPEMCW